MHKIYFRFSWHIRIVSRHVVADTACSGRAPRAKSRGEWCCLQLLVAVGLALVSPAGLIVYAQFNVNYYNRCNPFSLNGFKYKYYLFVHIAKVTSIIVTVKEYETLCKVLLKQRQDSYFTLILDFKEINKDIVPLTAY